MFNVPYRWTLHTIWTNISHMWYDLYYGIGNMIRWVPIIWFDRDFDWGYLARIMEYKFNRMGTNFKEYGHHTNSEKDARECFECAELLKHISGGLCYYARRYEKNHNDTSGGKLWNRAVSQDPKDDKKRLAHLIERHLDHWWD